jgi:predicted RNA binding protein YcfA (HicA-like mRNA interferase family)
MICWSCPNPRESPTIQAPVQAGLVTLGGQPGDDVASGTLNSILKQAGLKE